MKKGDHSIAFFVVEAPSLMPEMFPELFESGR
jgi:hypothetical protein